MQFLWDPISKMGPGQNSSILYTCRAGPLHYFVKQWEGKIARFCPSPLQIMGRGLRQKALGNPVLGWQ